MIVRRVPPNAIDRKLPSIMPDDCFAGVGVQNSLVSGVVLVFSCRSATSRFIAFNRARNSSTDSFDKSSKSKSSSNLRLY